MDDEHGEASPDADARPGAGQGVAALSRIVSRIVQAAYRQLENIDELAGKMSDAERKTAILECLLEGRRLFAQVSCILDTRGRFPDIFRVDNAIYRLVHERGMRITELADCLCVNHMKLTTETLPMVYDIPAALRLSDRQCRHGLPLLLTDHLDADDQLDDSKKDDYIRRLDRLIATRLSTLSLPADCRLYKIERGIASLLVLEGEVSVELSLVPDADAAPKWFLVDVRPVYSAARDKVRGALAVILQKKYNQTAFQQDTLLSIHSDIALYRSLFCLHQVYLQWAELKKLGRALLRLDHKEGQSRAHFYPQLATERLLFTLSLVSHRLDCQCSWDPCFAIRPSFDCFKLGEVILESAYRRLCSLALAPVQAALGSACQCVEFNVLVFQTGTFRSTISIDKQSGQFEVSCLRGQSFDSAAAVQSCVKQMAAEQFVASLSSHPKAVRRFSTTEQSKLGSFPKLFVGVDDDCIYLSVGMSDLQLACSLVFARPDARFPCLRTIVYSERISILPEQDFDLDAALSTLPYSVFRFHCILREAGIEYCVQGEENGDGDNSVRCLNLPLHIGVEAVVFVDEHHCIIRVSKDVYPLEEQVRLHRPDFARLLHVVKEYLRLMLVVSQFPQDTVAGQWVPLKVLVGGHCITISDEDTILFNGRPLETTSVSELLGTVNNKL